LGVLPPADRHFQPPTTFSRIRIRLGFSGSCGKGMPRLEAVDARYRRMRRTIGVRYRILFCRITRGYDSLSTSTAFVPSFFSPHLSHSAAAEDRCSGLASLSTTDNFNRISHVNA